MDLVPIIWKNYNEVMLLKHSDLLNTYYYVEGSMIKIITNNIIVINKQNINKSFTFWKIINS